MGKIRTVELFFILGYGLLVPVVAIVIGLLIFFKGRAYVRKKYGGK